MRTLLDALQAAGRPPLGTSPPAERERRLLLLHAAEACYGVSNLSGNTSNAPVSFSRDAVGVWEALRSVDDDAEALVAAHNGAAAGGGGSGLLQLPLNVVVAAIRAHQYQHAAALLAEVAAAAASALHSSPWQRLMAGWDGPPDEDGITTAMRQVRACIGMLGLPVFWFSQGRQRQLGRA